MTFKFSDRSEARLYKVHPNLVKVARRALEISPIDFGIPAFGGIRTAADQNSLYRDGKSKADGFVNKSNHQLQDDGKGYALDVYAYVDGAASWEKSHLSIVAAAFLQAACEYGIIIEWGGLWKNFVDMPHFQYVGVHNG